MILATFILLLGGCYKTNLVNFPSSGGPGYETVVWQHNLIVGLIPLTSVDIAATCGDKGVYAVQTKMTFVQILLAGITFNIYSPTSAHITCKS